MFDAIAPRYDFLNHVLSLGIDRRWRRRAVRKLADLRPDTVLDVATGTGDFALELLRQPAGLQPERIVGVDISREMLARGRAKVEARGESRRVELRYGDSEALDFPDASFDAATAAYGVRNFGDLDAGLREVRRVLRPGGRFVVLEFSRIEGLLAPLFEWYFRKILPRIGRWVSKDPRAYDYLCESVAAFPSGEDFLRRMREAGFQDVQCERLSFGISSIYTGTAA